VPRPTTLWTQRARPDGGTWEFTTGSDRPWDARLLRWDVLGSLGHIESLKAGGLVSAAEYRRLRRGLRAALAAVDDGSLKAGPAHEDIHTAVEDWLTRRLPGTGERLHTGRSRNDQVACDLRLYLKDRLLVLHAAALDLAAALIAFAARHADVLLPGYTHGRRAMPSSIGLWAGAYAEGLLDTVESLQGFWPFVDRSPLGSAAGYGVPLPLRREAAARALGFAGLDRNVATVQAGRGKLEAAALFWCAQLGHDVGRLAQDVILFTGDEFGYLILPSDLATGSSIMPHKRNPDLFELARGGVAAIDGDLAAVMQIRAKLGGGYHRDFQLLKEPLMRGLERAGQVLSVVAAAMPRLGVDRAQCTEGLAGGALATDEIMRRVEQGRAFRDAYREVADALGTGASFDAPSRSRLLARRRSTGGLGNLGLAAARTRLTRQRRWERRQRDRFDSAMARLAGKRAAK
jgi:argininosuccinate lyase